MHIKVAMPGPIPYRAASNCDAANNRYGGVKRTRVLVVHNRTNQNIFSLLLCVQLFIGPVHSHVHGNGQAFSSSRY